MLKSLHLQNFTVFHDATAEFCRGVNVIVGDNGTGKTHLLKMGYVAMEWGASDEDGPDTFSYNTPLALREIFLVAPENLVRLPSKDMNRPKARFSADFYDEIAFFEAIVSINLPSKETNLSFGSNSYATNIVAPVFFPCYPVISLLPSFIGSYKQSRLPFDKTWFDTCVKLFNAEARELSGDQHFMLRTLEDQMGGKVEWTPEGRFTIGGIDMHMIAEGHRKFAMLARLIATGTLKQTLFWDEPEANLNPRLLKVMAQVIHDLAKGGLQIILATHSLFLMRELWYLQKNSEAPPELRYLALAKGETLEAGVTIKDYDDFDDIEPLTALDAAAEQADRFLHADL